MTEYFAYDQKTGFHVPEAISLPIWDEGQELSDFLEKNLFGPTAMAVESGGSNHPSFEIYIRRQGLSEEEMEWSFACLFLLDQDAESEDPPSAIIFTSTAADGFDLRLRLRNEWLRGHLHKN